MSVVIPISHLVLIRRRKQLQKMIADENWYQLAEMEYELFQDINRAVEDPQRASKNLLVELGQVIKMYKELTALCHQYSKTLSV